MYSARVSVILKKCTSTSSIVLLFLLHTRWIYALLLNLCKEINISILVSSLSRKLPLEAPTAKDPGQNHRRRNHHRPC